MYRIGVDIGGTFTDAAAVDGSGRLRVTKAPTNAAAPAAGAILAVRRLLEQDGMRPEDVRFFAHGTTVGTNAVLERRGGRTALITTAGFRDLLEIGRQKRPHLYDTQVEPPLSLVRHGDTFEVDERTGPGGIIRPMSLKQATRMIAEIGRSSVEAVAICLLHSYAFPDHERRLMALARNEMPTAFITASHLVSPERGEYSRLATTVANAFVGPIMSRYLTEFDTGLRALGISASLYINQSNGGLLPLTTAAAHPVRTLLSGPSAGVAGAKWLARQCRLRSVMTLDMGGTSTDVCAIADGQPAVTHEREIGGIPIRLPSLDIETIGAGGGSVAWIDAGGALRVGPASAGATPGPACYGLGGDVATVSDANLVLGRLGTEKPLGAAIRLDPDAAHRAVGKVGDLLGLNPMRASAAIVAVANHNMLRALRLVSVQRGYDPRDFALMAYGGAGPLHAAQLADELGIRQVVVPKFPGILCAIGLLAAEPRLDLVRTNTAGIEASADRLRAAFDVLAAEAEAWFEEEGIESDQRELRCAIDLRYLGQGRYLTVEVVPTQLHSAGLRRRFENAHTRAYGYNLPETPLELVHVRLAAVARKAELRVARVRMAATEKAEPVGVRETDFGPGVDAMRTSVYERDTIAIGQVLTGPAVIEQMDSTTLVPPGHYCRVDSLENLVITRVSS